MNKLISKKIKYITTIFFAILISYEIAGSDTTSVLIKPKGEVTILTTPAGIRFGIWGKEVKYPASTLFIFAGTIEQSLGDPYFRQCGNQLAKEGFLCVSLDLPGHGLKKRDDEPEGLSAWRYRSDRGEDFVTPFVDEARSVLDYLIKAGYTESVQVAACGTSRGGFMALQFTAKEKFVRAAAAFCPVTELMALYEYDGATNINFVKSLSIEAKADELAGKSLWLIIGDRDERVGTDSTIEFARKVTKLSLQKFNDSDVILIVQPEPGGHTTPAHSPEKAAKWILEKLRRDQ